LNDELFTTSSLGKSEVLRRWWEWLNCKPPVNGQRDVIEGIYRKLDGSRRMRKKLTLLDRR